MDKELIILYDNLVSRYKEIVADKFSPQDFIEYNEILFSAHSCAIEGNSFSVDETRTLKERGLGMIPQGKARPFWKHLKCLIISRHTNIS